MLEKMEHIKIGVKEYPITFTLNILEEVQEIYGSMTKWQSLILGDGEKESSLKVIIWTFTEMMNEAIEIENQDKTDKMPKLEHKQVGRIVSQLGLQGALIHILKLSSALTASEEEADPNEIANPTQP